MTGRRHHPDTGSLVLLRRRHLCRRKIRMVLQILLPRFVAKHDTESPVRIHVDRFLHIQLVIRNRVLRRLCWIVLDQAEMHLAIHQPIVGHTICGAILQIQPNAIAFVTAINVHRTFVNLRRNIILKTIPIECRWVAVVSPTPGPPQRGPAGRPPKRIKSQARPKPEKRRAKKHSPAKNVNRARPKAETTRSKSHRTQTWPTRAHKTSGRRNRRTWRHAHTRPTVNVPASASVNAATRCLRNSRLNPAESQHPGSNNQNLPEDRTGTVRKN